MAADASIVARIGGDATGLVGALDKAKGAVRQFGDGVGRIADGIAKKFEFRDVARTLATALGLNLQSIANQVARFVIGFSKDAEDALDKAVDSTDKAADKQEKKLAEARAKKDKEEQEYVERRLKEDAVIRDARIQNYEDEKKRIQEAKDEAKKADDERRKSAADLSKAEYDAAEQKKTSAQKLAAFREQEVFITKEIATLTKLGGKRSADQDTYLIELKTALLELQKNITSETDKTAVAEGKVATAAQITNNELQKQEDFREKLSEVATENTLIIGNKAYGKSRSPEEIKRASDKELEEFVRRQKSEIQSIEAGKGRGPGALADAATNFLLQGTVIARLQTDVMRALSELNLRRGLKGDISMFGEDVARSRFGGDPLAFDKLVQQFVTDSRTTKEIGAQSNRLLEDIKRRLDGGILTLPTNVIKKGGG